MIMGLFGNGLKVVIFVRELDLIGICKCYCLKLNSSVHQQKKSSEPHKVGCENCLICLIIHLNFRLHWKLFIPQSFLPNFTKKMKLIYAVRA